MGVRREVKGKGGGYSMLSLCKVNMIRKSKQPNHEF